MTAGDDLTDLTLAGALSTTSATCSIRAVDHALIDQRPREAARCLLAFSPELGVDEQAVEVGALFLGVPGVINLVSSGREVVQQLQSSPLRPLLREQDERRQAV